MSHSLATQDLRARRRAFTLVEVLVSLAVLTVFLLIVSQLVSTARTITSLGNKHMDADSQARAVLDRMAVDFNQMLKRSDVDYYLKINATIPQPGNDQVAFFATAPGYNSIPGPQSPISLVSYRVNSYAASSSYGKLERLGKGLLWNGATPAPSVTPTATPASVSMAFLPQTMAVAWPTATAPDSTDQDYELIGPNVFRFEYFYLLLSQTVNGTPYASILSYTPWDTRISGHTALNAFQDVAAIGVIIAVIDPQSRVLVSSAQLAGLAGSGSTRMNDFGLNMHSGGSPTQPGDLDAQWQTAANTTTAIPRGAASGIRIYSRFYPIPH